MRKPSELIRLAVKHWSYPVAERYLCRVLERMKNEQAITCGEYELACNLIDEAIEYSETLSLYLYQNVSDTDSYIGGLNGGYLHPNDLRLQCWAFLIWDLARKCK